MPPVDEPERDANVAGPAARPSDATIAEPREPQPPQPSGTGAELPPLDDGRYVVGFEVARGGLGRVRYARDTRLDRPVAVKELLAPGDVAGRKRFVREALITARLQHPGIVPIYDAGSWPGGEPFYAMKLFSGGRPLSDLIAEAHGLEARLALLPNVLAAAETLAYAHSERVIHRDIKPDNILVGPFGETVVIDWGLAKDLSRPDEESEPEEPPAGATADAAPAGAPDSRSSRAAAPRASTASPYRLATQEGVTVLGSVVGTPLYMAPEQALGKPVDERADVYSLGALLHHVLSGRPPFEGTLEELLSAAISKEPPALETLQPGVPADLAAISRKAMAKRPDARYPTARELATDLRRFQTGQLVGAHDYTTAALVLRWLRRNRVPVAVAAAGLAALAVFGAFSLRSIVREKTRAEDARARAEERSRALTLVQARTALERDPTAAVTWLKTYPRGARESALVRSLAADAAARGVARHVLADFRDRIKSAAFSPDGTLLAAADILRNVRVHDVASGALVATFTQDGGTMSILFTADGRAVACGGNDGGILLGDVATRKTRTLEGHTAVVNALARTRDGKTLVSGSADGTVRAWSLADGSSAVVARHDGVVKAVKLLPAEDAVASAGADGFVRVATLSGKPIREWNAGQGALTWLAVSPDGTHVATGGEDFTIRAWDLATGRGLVLTKHESVLGGVAYSPDGTEVASASFDRTVRLTPAGGGISRVFRGHTDDIEHVFFSPDGRRLASAGLDGSVRVVDLASETVRVLSGHRLLIEQASFSPDGKWLLSASQDPQLRVWDAAPVDEVVLAGHRYDVDTIAFSADGERLYAAGHDDTVREWDRDGRPLRVFRGHTQPIFWMVVTPEYLVSGATDHTLRVWRLATREMRVLEGHLQDVTGLAAAADGHTVVSGSADGTARVWDVAAEAPLRAVLAGHEGAVFQVAISRGARPLVATAGADRSVRLWDLATGKAVRVLRGHEDEVHFVAFSPDGTLVASAGRDGTVRLWDASTGAARHVLRGHGDRVRALAFSPDGKLLASGAFDRTAYLWDVATGKGTPLLGHDSSLRGVAFSPDGKLVATVSNDRSTRLWDVASGELVWLRRAGSFVTCVAFSPDGKRLASGGWDRLVHVYPVDAASRIPPGEDGLARWMDALTTASTDARGDVKTRR